MTRFDFDKLRPHLSHWELDAPWGVICAILTDALSHDALVRSDDIHVYGPAVSQVTSQDLISMDHRDLIAKMSGELGRLEHIIKHLMATQPSPSPPAKGE